MKLVFATNNQNKLSEVAKLLPKNIELLSLKDINCTEEIEETGTTLSENALIKSKYIFDNYNRNCFSDDTGLEVDALNGNPGVYSARYAGDEGNSEKNMQKLLEELKGNLNRSAQFKTVISLIIEGKEYQFEGVCKGKILENKKGEKGFGYDPIFQPEGFDKSFAQMTKEEKGKISHRGKAIRKLIDFLSTYKK
jgi:XTP/dITP diphosphohydrolase